TSSVIPVGKDSTGKLTLQLQYNEEVAEGKYLLPVSVEVNKDDFFVKNGMNTIYFIVSIKHKVPVIAENHNYTTVFSDDGLDPKHLYFLGTPKGQSERMIWEYDIEGDSL